MPITLGASRNQFDDIKGNNILTRNENFVEECYQSVAWGIHGHIIMWHDYPIYNHQATKQEVYIVQGISMHHNDTESLRQHQNYETHIAKQI